MFGKGPEGDAPMTPSVLLGSIDLGEGDSELTVEEDGIVSEPLPALGTSQDQAWRLAAERPRALLGDEGSRAHVAGRPLSEGKIAQPLQQVFKVGRVQRLSVQMLMGAETLRTDTRRSSKGIDFQARIVGNRGAACELEEVVGLRDGVLFKGIERLQVLFLWGRLDARAYEIDDPQIRNAGQDRTDLQQLVGTARGQNQFGHSPAASA